MIKKLVRLIVFINMIQLSADATAVTSHRESTKFIIVANAPIAEGSDIEWKFIDEKRETHKIIALDGAANLFMRSGKNPDVVLGDVDSVEMPSMWGINATFSAIDDNSLPYMGKHGVIIVPAKNQDLTDLEKAILYCDKNGATSIDILNAHGGRMDHELGNYSLLKKYYKKDRPILIRTASQTLEFVRADVPTPVKIRGKKKDYCGIVGFPKGKIVTMRGFLYNADSYPLEMLGGSTCNQLSEPEAEIIVVGEVLVIHPNTI